LHLSSRAGSQIATEQTLAFIDVHAKQTSRHRATVAREISEAAKIGDDVLTRSSGPIFDACLNGTPILIEGGSGGRFSGGSDRSQESGTSPTETGPASA
jgi:hypothetical protein